MAKILFTSGITSIRGKFNGSQFSVGASGPMLQNKCRQRIGATNLQSIRRSNFSYLSRYWHSLSPTDKAANAAAAFAYPYTDKFGNTRYLTGYQLLLRSNINLSTANLPPINVVATTSIVPPAFAWSDVIASVRLLDNAQDIVVGWSASSPADDWSVVVYRSPVVSPGQSVYSGEFLLLGNESVTVGEAAFTQLNWPPGYNLVAGQQVFVKANLVYKPTGVMVSTLQVGVIIEAI